MPLQMQRLLKDMRELTDVEFAEPDVEPSEDELFVALMPTAIRHMAAVLSLKMAELRKEVFYFVHDVSTAPEDTIDKLRRYVDFIMSTMMHETEELIPEVADLKRKGALIVFRKKWTIYAVENAMKPDPGVPMDVIAELVAEQFIDNVDRENEDGRPTTEGEFDPPEDFELPDDAIEDQDNEPGAWGDDGGVGYLMDQAGWFDQGVSIVMRGRGEEDEEPDDIDDDDDDDDSDDDRWD